MDNKNIRDFSLDSDILEFRLNLLKWFSIGMIFASIFMTFIGFITSSSYILLTIAFFVLGIICFLLQNFRKINFASFVLILGFSIITFERTISIKSTFNLANLSLLIIATILMSNLKVTTLLFIIHFTLLSIATGMGYFTLTQSIDPDVGLYYANTIAPIIPNWILGYLVAFAYHKVILGSIRKLKEKNEFIRKTQEQLINQEKFNSIQLLAGGIAHDFNNILTSMLGNISLVKEFAQLDEEYKNLLIDAENATIRARGLTKELLLFSKDIQPDKIEMNNIDEIIKETAIFSIRGSKSKLNFNLNAKNYSIFADQSQFSQVIQNMVINADQAMSKPGEIKISTEICNNSKILEKKFETDKILKISIEDEGIGISENNLNKVFDPFFSTKENGTGLGLSICKSIINNHNGIIKVHSLKIGTRFEIYLPTMEDSDNKSKLIELEYDTLTGRILIMDDDKSVQKTLGAMLRKIGLQVDFCNNGEEAAKKYKDSMENSNKYDLIIMDLTIPGGLGGLETIKILKKIDPNVKAIVSTGYSSKYVDEDFKMLGFIEELKKPYSMGELYNLLKKFLN